jgi:integrase
MAPARPTWLADLSRSFKRHRQGRPAWFIEEHRDRLRLRSDEFPPRPGSTSTSTSTRQAVTLTTSPGPATAAHALSEACAIFDAVMAGTWRWAERGGQEGDSNLVPYGMRHAFALRLGVDLGLRVREAAELMGHSLAVHLSTYGRQLDRPKLLDKVAGLVAKR